VLDVLDPSGLARRLRRDAERSALRARYGIKHLAGIGRAPVGTTPKDPVWQRDKVVLHRYRSDQRCYGPPVLLVMSLVTRPYVFDLRPGSSFVEVLLGRGLDVFLLDWGVPDEVEADNSLETYCDEYLPLAAAAACDTAGAVDLTVFGYCYGGVLCLLYAAGHPGPPVRNLAVMATPVDWRHMGPMTSLVQRGRLDPDDLLDDTGNVPAEVVASSFRLLKPTGDLVSYANLWQNLWDDRYVESYQAMTRWANDHIPFPGAAMRQTVELFVRQNALLSGEVPLAGGRRRLADIECPFLSVVAEHDHITPPGAVAPLIDLVGSQDRTQMRLPAGHVGLVVGRGASTRTMPAMADWIVSRSGPPAAPAEAP
jgi:polyhydroxyalkanoate synthase